MLQITHIMSNVWTFDDGAYKRFAEFINVISPSMNEVNMAYFLREAWTEKGLDVNTDVMGNIHTAVNNDGKIHVGIIAHMDTIAIQITNILPCGLLQFRSIGLRSHVLLGQPMMVFTEKGIINGVVGFDPTSQYGQPKGLIDDDLWLDIGVLDYDTASIIVSVGDLAVLKPSLNILNKNIISGTGIDDRIGLFVVNECLDYFFDNNPAEVCLHVIGTVQEEIGLRGAEILASQYHLDACFVVDVDYATDTLASHENQMGRLCLGKGVGVHFKSDNNPVLRRLVLDVAEKNDIKYQKSLGRFLYGGTDATPLQLQCGGIATMNINIPCRYMHSPVEMCHKKDVENTIKLLIKTIEYISKNKTTNFIPSIDLYM